MTEEIKMCKFSLTKPKKFIDSLGVISKLINEATFNFTKDGLNITAMDPANVAMVILNFKAAGFVEYDCPEDTKFGVDFGKLTLVLKRTKDILKMEFGDRIVITNTGKTTKQFTLPIIELDDKQQKIPELVFKATAKMQASDLSSAIEDAEIVGEAAMFACQKGKFGILAESELKSASIDLVPTEIVVAQDEVIKGKYAIEYLKKMVAGSKISEETTIRFGHEYPLKIEFKDTNIDLSFVLAPRVENV